MSKPLISEVVDYLDENYAHDDAMRLSGIKMIVAISMKGVPEGRDYKSIIDKIALFNGINKKGN